MANVIVFQGQPWLSEAGAGSSGLWNVELPKAITASALEEMQYMVLEKAHQVFIVHVFVH